MTLFEGLDSGVSSSTMVPSSDSVSTISVTPVEKVHGVIIDRKRDALLTSFGKAMMTMDYLMPGESFQDRFACVAHAYGDNAAHSQRIYDYISQLFFMPATPVLSNGGTTRGLAVSCYLTEMNDSLGSIVEHWNENIWLAAKGGGIGSYWGNLRGIGEKVGANGKTSGVVPFIKVMDSLTLAISQGSLRRGSAAVYLPVDHPEIEEFIEIRRPTGGDPNRKTLNLHNAVVVSDAFMRAVEKNASWDLVSPHGRSVMRTVNARELWIRILTARIELGEPYILFSDTVNRAVPEHHRLSGLNVKMSNLCLTGETRIVTDAGIKTLKQLFDSQENFAVISDTRTFAGARVVNGRKANAPSVVPAPYGTSIHNSTKVFKTAINAPVWKLTTKMGRVLRGTEQHGVMTQRGWVLLGELKKTDYVMIQSGEGTWSTDTKLPNFSAKQRNSTWTTRYSNMPLSIPTEWSSELGECLGWLTGKGYIAKGTNWPSFVFGDKEQVLIPYFKNILETWFPGMVHLHESSNIPHLVVRDARAGEFFAGLGVKYEDSSRKVTPASLWNAPRDAVVGFLRGLFSSDGGVVRSGDARQVGLGSISRILLDEIQILLSNFGINTTVYHRRNAGESMLPSSDCSVYETYATKDFWEIRIGNINRNIFVNDIGFIHAYKQDNVLDFMSAQVKRGAYSEKFLDAVESVERDGTEDVYDITVDDSHSFVANGIVVHNCSEITLPTGLDHLGNQRTAVCCLSSLNLDKWDIWSAMPGFIEDVMRFLDNVLQGYIDTAPDTMSRAKYSAMRERSVGLGVMGFHSMLQSKGIPFESPMARVWNKKVFRHIKQQVDTASITLAHEKGACPDAAEHGILERFSYKMAIAPTASISVICGQASPGIDPFSANAYNEKRKIGSFEVRNAHLAKALEKYGMNNEAIWSSIMTSKGSVQHLEFLTDAERATFRTAFELDQRAVIQLAADRASYICQAQSVNLFLPADVHKRDLHQIHLMAWQTGVKSLYYCRSLSIQRAQTVSDATGGAGDSALVTFRKTEIQEAPTYEVCEACQ